ncbi:MAG: hypothetical protein RL095_2162 [Verrucomicrobiota bacterium]|jgi:hypothetical protein
MDTINKLTKYRRLILCCLLIFCTWYLTRCFDLVFPENKDLLSPTISLVGILIGFLIAIKAIILTSGSSSMALLKKAGAADEVFISVRRAVKFGFFFSSFCIACYIAPNNSIVFFVWAALLVVQMFYFYDSVDLMFLILERDHKQAIP